MIRTLIVLLVCTFFNSVFAQTFDPVPSFISDKVQRALPLIQLDTKQDIYLSDYGAYSGDGLDDLPGLEAAVDYAKSIASEFNPVRIVFDENGTYNFRTSNTSNSYIYRMEDVNNIVFDGQGSELISHIVDKGFFFVYRGENIIFQDIKIDYDPLPFTQGQVKSVDFNSGTFVLELSSGMPEWTSRFGGSQYNSMTFKHSDGSGRLKPYAPDWRTSETCTKISGNTYNCYAGNSDVSASLDVDDYVVYNDRKDAGVFMASQSKNITYLRDIVYTGPGGAFGGWDNYEVNIIECQLKPKTGRVHSTVADAIHYSGSYRGPWVQDSYFSGYNDDSGNLKHSTRSVSGIPSATTITVNAPVEVGEIIRFYNPRDGELLSTCNVIEVSGTTLTLDRAHNVTNAGGGKDNDTGFLISRSCQGFIYRNNTFENARGWGLIIQARDGQVKNNTYKNISSGAIKFDNIQTWSGGVEGFTAGNIEITGNQIINCGTSWGYYGSDKYAAIYSQIRKGDGSLANYQGIEDITITGNYIEYDKAAVNLQTIDCLTYENNNLVYSPTGLYSGPVTPLQITNTTYCNGNSLQGINLFPVKKTLTQENETLQLEATLLPNDYPSTTITWVSDNPSIASVDTNGLVTANSEGIASISAKTPGDEFIATSVITVAFNNPTDPLVHFPFDEEVGASTVINTGRLQNIKGMIELNDGSAVLNPGYTDSERGQVIESDTGNGHIILFNGIGPYGGLQGSQARTYSFWIKPNEFKSYNDIIFGPDHSIIFDQQTRLIFKYGSDRVITEDTLEQNEWNYVTVIIPENGTLRDIQFYLNTIPCTLSYNNSNNPAISTDGDILTISSELNGFLSDLRYYDYVLSTEEIQNLYNPLAVESISISPETIYIKPGEERRLSTIFTPSNATNRLVDWESSSSSIATIDVNGYVTGVQNGEATITVTSQDGQKTATCTVIVDDSIISVDEITLDKSEATLEVETNLQLTHTISPSVVTDDSILWTSSNTEIATVDENGLITAISNGAATITATAVSGGATATCNITVITKVTDVAVNPKAGVFAINETLQLETTIYPVTATNQTVSWSSSNPSIFSVDENGLVTALQNGEAIITVTTNDGNFTDTCSVIVGTKATSITVNPTMVSLNLLETTTLTANVLPGDAIINSYTWSSENESIATVDENGLVTGVGMGLVNIIATSDDGNHTATCMVAVNNVAYNKPVTTASEFNANASKSNINDLDFNSNWNSYSFNNGWIEFDLGAEYDISQFALFPKDQDPYQYTIGTKPDGGSTFTTVVDRSSNTEGIEAIVDDVAITARYVRLELDGISGNVWANTFRINEFMIFGALQGSLTGISINPESLTLTTDETYILEAVPQPNTITGLSVTWSTDDNSIVSVNPSTGEITANNPGTTNINANANGFSAVCEVTVTQTLTVETNDFKNSIKVFPNPTKGLLNISMESNPHNNLKVNITDLSGRIIIKKQLRNLNNNLDLSQLSNGLYLLSIRDRTHVIYQQKIVLYK